MTIDDAIGNLVTRVKELEASNTTLNTSITSIDDRTNKNELEILSTLVPLHYKGYIDISNYYSVGDIIHGVSLKNGDNLDEIVDLVVIGVKHDTINGGSTKAALTLSQVNCLNETRKINSSNNGYTYAKYSTSTMRTWINDTYYNALPSTLQSLIKTVNKTTAEPASSSEYPTTTVVSSTEKCFLPSCYEMFGTGYNYYSETGINVTDGTQYEYYKTASNRKKYLGRNGTSSDFDNYWTRSGFITSNNAAIFIVVSYAGSVYHNGALFGSGFCPAFCV
jgi:hypothetical protein